VKEVEEEVEEAPPAVDESYFSFFRPNVLPVLKKSFRSSLTHQSYSMVCTSICCADVWRRRWRWRRLLEMQGKTISKTEQTIFIIAMMMMILILMFFASFPALQNFRVVTGTHFLLFVCH
jgi:hypothetical protein